MKKKSVRKEIPYGSLSHHLKSPLAGLQSLVMIVDRALKKENNLSYTSQLASLHDKVDILNARITQVMEYVRLQQDDPALLYAFFPVGNAIDEAIGELSKEEQQRITRTDRVDQEIMADRALIVYAVRGLLQGLLVSCDTVLISQVSDKDRAEIRFVSRKQKQNGEFSEQSVEASLLMATAHLVVTRHDGEVCDGIVGDERVITFVLPLRQKRR